MMAKKKRKVTRTKSGLTTETDPNCVIRHWDLPFEDRPPIYIVTGFPRSGTSMMMQSLEAGGLPCEYNTEDESHVRVQKETGYMPNPGGFYEVGRGAEPWFYPGYLHGRAVKMELASMPAMCPGQRYRVILMTRNPEAIRRSLDTYTDALEQIGIDKPQLRKALLTVKAGRYQEMMGVAFQHLKNRRDVEHIVEAPYESVLEAPRSLFEKLKEAGWPIDVEKASQVPQNKWNRSGSTESGPVS